jgi:hypothetical protein
MQLPALLAALDSDGKTTAEMAVNRLTNDCAAEHFGQKPN